MQLPFIISQIQANPSNFNAYRQLIDYYKSCGQLDEAQAFEYLIDRKINEPSSPDHNVQRRSPNSENSIVTQANQ